jgi:MFS transporter, ACS family, solute carrier family 17 (sodium-dependent inorganic phosphate cotransporter), other
VCLAGTVQAAFFWGYMLCQLPGGYLASLIGGRKLLAGGVVLFSAMTCATPLLATTIPGMGLVISPVT